MKSLQRLWFLVPLAVACGGHAEELQPREDDSEPSRVTAAPEPTVPATSVTFVPPLPTLNPVTINPPNPSKLDESGEVRDPIFDYPELAPGVTSVLQPSHFADANEDTDPPLSITAVGDAGSALPTNGGTGDLTLLLVFDKSSSMLFDWNGQTRWQVANESLRGALDGILDVLTIGVIRFPLETQCGVPEFDSGLQIDFTSGREFVTIWQSLEHRLESLGTPLGTALNVADRAIATAREEGRLTQRFRVLLVTDGEPNCSENLDAMTHLLVSWYEQNVETMVIGLPGSDAAAHILDSLAAAGGTGIATMTATREELGTALAAAAR
jgi:hypothetical protein